MTLAFVAGCTSGPRHGADAGAGDAAVSDASDGVPAVRGELLPPPISGGTLLITRDGLWAVASDPDTDHVSIVGLASSIPGCSQCDVTPALLASLKLGRGEEPGRSVEDGVGRVHVVLRRGGAIATIDLASGVLLARRPVCPAPRGIAYDAGADLLHVACASGELVSLSPLRGTIERRIPIDVDLRDVVVVPDGLVVSRFKTAELIRLDREGNIVARIEPQAIERGPQDLSDLKSDPMAPAVAWRTVSTPSGNVFMLHQYALARPIELGESGAAAAPVPSPYAAPPGARCGGIVAQTVSALGPGGEIEMGMPMPSQSLSVDVAASSDGAWLAVAHAGAHTDQVTIYRAADLAAQGRSPVRCADQAGRVIVDGQPIAVAIHPGRTPAALADQDWLIVQTRAPASLRIYRGFATPETIIPLDGPPVRDNGHDLFHFDGGGGIACAQCHPEGGEDGRVWRFLPLGDRRTQAVNVGLEGTEPFHWSGNLPTLEALVNEVFVHRMGGSLPSQPIVRSLQHWLFSLTPPAPRVDSEAPEAVRGRALYDSARVGCSGCHSATSSVYRNGSVDVGVESPSKFQIPRLQGVGYRAPFLHNGCAATLRDRFEPSCGGGDKHGTTSQLTSAEVDDLISYLHSL